MQKKYNLELNRKIIKFLAKNQATAKIFYRQVNILVLSPFDNFLDIKKLRGTENKYRLRIGKYRFLYEIIEDKVVIYFYDAGSRGGIYK